MQFNGTYSNILINRRHIKNPLQPYRLTYDFPATVKFNKGSYIGISYMKMYNSVYNVEAITGNNSFSLIWNADTTTQYNFTLRDGFYSIDKLNTFLEQQCVLNNLYVTDAEGNNIYFATIEINEPIYGAEIRLFPLPTATQATTLGYTKPASATWNWPTSATTPQLIIPSQPFGNLIGFSAKTYPSTPQATTQQFYNDLSPAIAPVSNVVMNLNLVSSKYGTPINAFYSFGLDVQFGGLIEIKNSNPTFLSITEGTYNIATIELLDTNYQPLRIHDLDISITLIVRDP